MRTLATSFVLACLTLPLCAQEAEKPAEPVPQQQEKKEPKVVRLGDRFDVPITLRDIDDDELAADDLAGKIVVVNFWSTQCPVMQGWEERYAAIHREYAERGVVFVTVNANVTNGELNRDEVGRRAPAKPNEKELAQPFPEIRAYLRANELPYRVLVDPEGKLVKLLDAKTTPDIFVFDRGGRLTYRGLIAERPRRGSDEKPRQHLTDVLDTLLDAERAKEFEPYETRPQGCSIKLPRPQNDGPPRRRR